MRLAMTGTVLVAESQRVALIIGRRGVRVSEPEVGGMWERLEGREIKRRAPRAGTQGQEGVVGHRPRPDLPAGTDLLPQIRHIVILMMENHSYDNYLGMLTGRGEGLPLGPEASPQPSTF
jgi:phospholipase C